MNGVIRCKHVILWIKNLKKNQLLVQGVFDAGPYRSGFSVFGTTVMDVFCLGSLWVLFGLIANLCLAADVSKSGVVVSPRSNSGSSRGRLWKNNHMQWDKWVGKHSWKMVRKRTVRFKVASLQYSVDNSNANEDDLTVCVDDCVPISNNKHRR